MDFTEAADDRQMLQVTFDHLDTDKNGSISMAEILAGLSDSQIQDSTFSHFADTLKFLKTQLSADSEDIDFIRFQQAMDSVPRVHGYRIQWARSLGFETHLASLLPPGPIFDPLREIKSMSDETVLEILNEASKKIFEKFKVERDKLNQSGLPDGADDMMSKFVGDIGKFGDTGMFEEGLENQIGNPDPYVLKGIIRENAMEEESGTLSITPNYSIVYSPMREYARLLGHPSEYDTSRTKLNEEDLKDNEGIPIFLLEVANGQHSAKGPTIPELKELRSEFAKLRECYAQVSKSSEERLKQALFPGDIGYIQTSMQLNIRTSVSGSAKKLHAAILELSGFASSTFVISGFPPPPTEQAFTISVFGAASAFVADAEEQKLRKLVADLGCSADIKRTDVVYIYCMLEPLDGNGSALKELLQNFNSETISQISGLDCSCEAERHISTIAEKAKELRSRADIGSWLLVQVLELLQKLDLDVLSQISGLGSGNKQDHIAVMARSVLDPENNVQWGKRVVLVQGRRSLRLSELMSLPEVEAAELRVEEAIQAYQYTGPLYQTWNGVLRSMPFPGTDAEQRLHMREAQTVQTNQTNEANPATSELVIVNGLAEVQEPKEQKKAPANLYATSIHTLVSACQKLSRTTKIPEGRKVYRGLGRMKLGAEWSKRDARGAKSGVELGFMSTTFNRNVALEYSGVKRGKAGTIFEIEVGAVDIGARLDPLSQYPGEGELLISPLSHLEVVGNPRVENFDVDGAQKPVVVISIKININQKAKVLEEILGLRKLTITNAAANLRKEIRFDLRLVSDAPCAFTEFDGQVRTLLKHQPEWFNSETNFKDAVSSVIRFKEEAIIKSVTDLENVKNASNILLDAARRGKTEVAKALVLSKADVNVFNDQETPLTLAARNGHADTVRGLMGLRADPRMRGERGWNALHLAAQGGHTETVVALVEGDRPSILKRVGAAICCSQSALIHTEDLVIASARRDSGG